jgi:hypothetical protein
LPNLLARDEATREEAAAMMLVVKKIDPNFPSSRPYRDLKKYITQDLRVCKLKTLLQ